MSAGLKNDILTVRVSPDMKMQLDDISRETGYSVSAITKAAISKLLSSVYSEDGDIVNPEIVSARKVLECRIACGYFPVSEVSKVYGIPERTIHTLISRGKVPRIVISKKRHIQLANIEKLLKDGKKNKYSENRRLRSNG